MGGMNDVFMKAWLEGAVPQRTDTHWRCSNGAASFNWRMIWNVELPRRYFYLTVQAWDRDLLKVLLITSPLARFPSLVYHLQYSDCLGEAKLDLGPHIKRAL